MNEVRGLSSECQIMDGTEHPGLAVCKGWSWEKSPPADGIMLSPRGEQMIKALGGTRESNLNQRELAGLTPCHSHTTCLVESCSPGSERFIA